MELIKELPEVFEEFAEQRQKSFMAMKGLKDQGVPVVGRDRKSNGSSYGRLMFCIR